MFEIVTFFTTDYSLHYGFFEPIMVALLKKGKMPIMLFVSEKDPLMPNCPFNRISMRTFRMELFKTLKPIAHIQMQSHDKLHRNIMLGAKTHRIRTFEIQHGSLVKDENGDFDINTALFDTVSEYVCVWGEDYVPFYVDAGIPKENVLLTGNPRHDVFPPRKKKPIKKVLLTTAATRSTDGDVNFGCDYVESFRRFLEVVDAFPDIKFYIKSHPTPFDDENLWRNEIVGTGKPFPNLSIIDKHVNFISVLSTGEIDCLFHYVSSTAGDAAVYGIPLIDMRRKFDFREELQNIIDGKPPRSNQLETLITDRRASERIVAKILEHETISGNLIIKDLVGE